MRPGQILAQEAKLAQAFARHEMGVINDGHEHLARLVDLEGLLNELPFALMILTVEFDVKGMTEDA